MPLVLKEVSADKDFQEIANVLYTSFGEPYNSLRQWFIPVQTTVEAAIDDLKGRLLKNWKQNAHLHWLKVTDTDSGSIVGATEWEIRETVEKWDSEKKPINAYWHTEGSEEKAFAEKLLTSLKSFMNERMLRPHLELEQIVVLPDQRKKGVAKLLIDWGVTKADKSGLETCVQSVPFAVPIYEKCGFGNLDVLESNLEVPMPSEKWQAWANEDLRTFLMWRPAGHAYRKAEDRTPWLDV